VTAGDIIKCYIISYENVIWGSFSVDNPTLNRFFSLHYLLPFLIAALVVLHLIALHLHASNNPLGLNSNIDKLPFHPYFTSKDLVGFVVFGIIFSYFIFFQPNLLGQRMAVFDGNVVYNYNTICWNSLFAPKGVGAKASSALLQLLIVYTQNVSEISTVTAKDGLMYPRYACFTFTEPKTKPLDQEVGPRQRRGSKTCSDHMVPTPFLVKISNQDQSAGNQNNNLSFYDLRERPYGISSRSVCFQRWPVWPPWGASPPPILRPPEGAFELK
jgi:hypothetical protein